MYSSKFVATVIVNGQIQKELANGVVPIPFGSHYVLRFRNKHDRRAVVKFFIDGENVSGNGYIIPANDKVDIRRHAERDESFQFVSLDSPEATDHGKNGPNPDKIKGVIEARFYLERHRPTPVYNPWGLIGTYNYPTYTYPLSTTWQNLLDASKTDVNNTPIHCSSSTVRSNTMNVSSSYAASSNQGMPLVAPASLQEGCTVPGAATGQTLYSSYIDVETDFVTLKLVLQGFHPELPKPTKVAVPPPPPGMKAFCENCGTARTPGANFCGSCGFKL